MKDTCQEVTLIFLVISLEITPNILEMMDSKEMYYMHTHNQDIIYKDICFYNMDGTDVKVEVK